MTRYLIIFPLISSAYQFLLVVSKNDATHLSDKPLLRNDLILYLRRSRARRFSSPRFNLKGGALSFIARHIVLRAGTNDFEFESLGDIETAVVSDLMSRKRMGMECGWKGEENGNRVESWEYIVSYLASRSKLLRGSFPLPLLLETEGRGIPEKERWRGNGGGEKERNILVYGKVTLRFRQWSLVVILRPNGHDVCLFRPACHNTPTTDRSGVLTSVMYLPRNPR